MLILAIDPGPEESGLVFFDAGVVHKSATLPNREVLDLVRNCSGARLAIEMVASFGMAVGKEVFETVRWIGRFQQAAHAPMTCCWSTASM
ncbi:MAG: hypothetical protein ACRENP_21310 [Longimicrobiales bacterium]